MKFLIMITCFLLLLGCFHEKKKSTTHKIPNISVVEGGDLLTLYARKPINLKYLSCKQGEGQLIWEAEYRVSSQYIEEVENFFVTEYGMGELVFTCCGWEPEGGKTGQTKNGLVIWMGRSCPEDSIESCSKNKYAMPEFSVFVRFYDA